MFPTQHDLLFHSLNMIENKSIELKKGWQHVSIKSKRMDVCTNKQLGEVLLIRKITVPKYLKKKKQKANKTNNWSRYLEKLCGEQWALTFF